jgi:hypothetical protein
MSEQIFRWRAGVVALAVVVVGLMAIPGRSDRGPIDLPASTEPRVAVAKGPAGTGLRVSQGVGEPFKRPQAGASLYSRDLLLALPGFQADVVPNSKGVKLTLYGNLPELSDSNALESAVTLHDTSVYDLDCTLLRGRIVLTNTKKEGEAKVWLRTGLAGVQMTLHEPGDRVAVEISGRWAPGVPFSLKPGPKNRPVALWDVYVLKGKMDAKAGKNEFSMSAPPGRAYFHGDSVNGPAEEGPQPLKELPSWADPKALKAPALKMAQEVAVTYRKIIDETDESERVATLLAAAAKDKDKDRALMLRRLVVFALAAMDSVDEVAKLLNESKYAEVRQTAVIALRHWIGAGAGRDEKLYHVLIDDVRFTKGEAETLMQLLHSPFDPEQAETYETLIAYLNHRRQAVRELAHWHLVRLAPVGRKIPFDASAAQAVREKSAAAWEKLVPAGTLPKDADDTKDDKKDKEKGKK